MLYLSGETNAHVAETTDYYSYKLCCNLTGGGVSKNLESNCVLGVPFIKLAAPINSHAEAVSSSFYGIQVCFKTSELQTGFDCSFESECSNERSCILTLSSSTNAHAATCDPNQAYAYSNKICCKAVSS